MYTNGINSYYHKYLSREAFIDGIILKQNKISMTTYKSVSGEMCWVVGNAACCSG